MDQPTPRDHAAESGQPAVWPQRFQHPHTGARSEYLYEQLCDFLAVDFARTFDHRAMAEEHLGSPRLARVKFWVCLPEGGHLKVQRWAALRWAPRLGELLRRPKYEEFCEAYGF